MSVVNLPPLHNQANLTFSFQHPTKPKIYHFHPMFHLNHDDWKSIGKGMTGNVMRAKFLIMQKDKPTKEKKLAIKFFHSLQSKSLDEFECHTEILTRIENFHEQIKALNIHPGRGIEKKPMYAFFDPTSHKNYIVKQLYNEDLTSQMFHSGLPKFYIDLILLMLNPDVKSRINIYDAYNLLKNF